jgi:membrane fusion protein, heavy metal efflux system
MKGGAAVILLAAALMATSRTSGARQATMPADGIIAVSVNSEAARHIAVAAVQRKKIAGYISATATVEPNANAVAEIATRIPARVMRLIAEPGQSVTPGQPLALLSSVELGMAKTQYLKTRSLERIAAQNLRREEELYAKKITPMKDLLAARANHDTALAEYKAARETLSLLIAPDELEHLEWSHNSRPLSEFSLTSPIAGTLVRRNLTLGEAVDRDRPLMTVIDLDRMWVTTNVFEHDLGGLRVGAKALLRVDAYPGRLFEGHVFYVGDELDNRTRTVAARIEVPNPDHLLKSGMFAHADIQDNNSGTVATAVPLSAVYDIDGGRLAFVALGQDRFVPRRLKLGVVGDTEAEVISGLSEGEQVVVRGGLALKALLLNHTSSRQR